MIATKLGMVLLPLLAAVGEANASEKQSGTDWYGDPLPPGALARLGTVRLRHVGAVVVFSRDGKELISAGADEMLRYWDPVTGKEKRSLRVQAGDSPAQPSVFAANGRTVAGCSRHHIHVWDTATGKELGRFPMDKISIAEFVNRSASVGRLALSPDGKNLAAQFHDQRGRHYVLLWEVTTGKNLFTLIVKDSDNLAFSPDGKFLGTVGRSEGLRLLESSTGKEIRKIAGTNGNLAFSPGGKRVAANTQAGGVKVWNMVDGKEVFQVKPVPGRWPGTLAFSADNKILSVSFPEGVVLYDVAASKKLRTLGTTNYGQLAFSPDGKTAATFSGSSIHVWDVATGKEIGVRAGHESSVVFLIAAPDGSSIATCAYDPAVQVHLWDTASGQPITQLPAQKRYVRAAEFTPDGRFLITGGGDGVFRMWDRKTFKEVRNFTIESRAPVQANFHIWAMGVSFDGERLVAVVMGADVCPALQLLAWDIATGKVLTRRTFSNSAFGICFSPDARSMMSRRDAEIVIEDIATGKELVKVAGRASLAFSPNGQILALAPPKPKSLPPGKAGAAGGRVGEIDAVCLVELATGKRLVRMETGRVDYNLLAYSPDGRTLATADRDCFRIWDVATGRELFHGDLPEKNRGNFGFSFATSLAFLPGGDRLATGLLDSTTLIWDLQPKSWHAGIAVKKAEDVDLSSLWSDLAGDDAAKAHRAVWTLAAIPDKAVPFLKEHLHPAAALDAKRVRQLITDLDSPEFVVREQARKKLASFGELAEPPLRKALAGKPSLEARRRLEALLADAEKAGRGVVHSKEVLRTLRAIRALEHMGDRQARQLLQTLAAGAAGVRQTRLAKEALHRLQRAPIRANPSTDPR